MILFFYCRERERERERERDSLFCSFPLFVYDNFVTLSLSLSLIKIQTLLSLHFAKFSTGIVFCFVLQMYFSLPQLFVFFFDVLSVAVFVVRDRFVKKKK